MCERQTIYHRRWVMGPHTLEIGERPLIMGILNITPDSFSDGGDHIALERAVAHARHMVAEGADIIDVGGESTRPGADYVSEEEEMNRVLPVIRALADQIDVPISIDTYKAKVGRAALEAGAHIINDVWGFQQDPDLARVAAEMGAPVILMHNQDGTAYPNGIFQSIERFFEKSLEIAKKAGVSADLIALDPGIGFGKTAEQNLYVMKHLDRFKSLGYPILLGTSRKSMIGKVLDVPPKERVSGTVATSVMGFMAGAQIFRVHDVRENREALAVTRAVLESEITWTE